MPVYPRQLKIGLRYYYKFNYKRVMYRSECIYLSKNEAKKAENDKYDEVTDKAQNPSQNAKFSLLEIVNNRLDSIKVKKSKNYYDENKRYFKKLLEYFGPDISIYEIEMSQIEDMLLMESKRLQEEEKDNYAVNASLRIYKALFQATIKKHKLRMLNPCIGIDLYSVVKKMKYIPSLKEIKKVKSLCDDEQKFLIDFVMQTGARINEALKVTGEDIGKGFVILHTRKSKNSDLVPRKVPLKIKLPKLKDSELLFKRWKTHPKFLEIKVKKLKQRSWSWHNLRHRFASLLSKKKNPLFEIMTLLGHSQLSTTQKYLQLLP